VPGGSCSGSCELTKTFYAHGLRLNLWTRNMLICTASTFYVRRFVYCQVWALLLVLGVQIPAQAAQESGCAWLDCFTDFLADRLFSQPQFIRLLQIHPVIGRGTEVAGQA